MADFGGMVLTDVGKNLQAAVQTGEQLNFVRIALGDGVLPQGGDLEAYTDLVNEMKSVSPTVATVIGDGTARIRGTLTNAGMATGFFIREIGLFAEDPDNPGEEILYAIAYASNPDYLPASGGATAVEQVIDLVVVVSNATNIVVTVDGDHYLTDADLEAHNADPTEHAPIRAATTAEIDGDIETHNADGDAHPALRDEINADITVHNADAGAHTAIQTKIGTDVEAHNIDSGAHADIRTKIDTDISAHNADQSAHGIQTQITAHDENGSAHAGLMSGVSDEIDADILAHNTDAAAHTAIQTKIGTDIAAHNASGSAHADVRTLIDDNSKRSASKRVLDRSVNVALAVGDFLSANTGGGSFTATLPASGDSDVGDRVTVSDVMGAFGTYPLTIARNGMSIQGIAEDMLCDVGGITFSLVRTWDGWRIA